MEFLEESLMILPSLILFVLFWGGEKIEILKKKSKKPPPLNRKNEG